MVRKIIFIVSALIVAMTSVASARPESPARSALQTGEEPASATAAAQLQLGERFSNAEFDLEVQDAFSVDSPLYPGYDEVRVSVAFRHFALFPALNSSLAFRGDYGYPVLRLVDSNGETHLIPAALNRFYSVPGSNLVAQPPGIPARWSVGFRVPSSANADLTLEALWQDQVVAEWDLTGVPVSGAGWDRPSGYDSAVLGDVVRWGDQLQVRPLAVSTAVCGDPQYGHVTANTSLLVTVSNPSTTDALWPDIRHPDVTAIAVWADGSSARFGEEFPALYEDDTDEQSFDRMLIGRNLEQIAVPPGTDNDRFMDFYLPRDPRFVDVAADPVAVVLYPPDAPPIWVDVTTTPAGAIADFTCAFPEHLFLVDLEGAAPEPPPPPEPTEESTLDA